MCICPIWPINDQLNEISIGADADMTDRIGPLQVQSDDLKLRLLSTVKKKKNEGIQYTKLCDVEKK